MELFCSVIDQKNVEDDHDLQLLLQDILFNNLSPYKCVVVLCDSIYFHIFRNEWFKKFDLFISYFIVSISHFPKHSMQ